MLLLSYLPYYSSTLTYHQQSTITPQIRYQTHSVSWVASAYHLTIPLSNSLGHHRYQQKNPYASHIVPSRVSSPIRSVGSFHMLSIYPPPPQGSSPYLRRDILLISTSISSNSSNPFFLSARLQRFGLSFLVGWGWWGCRRLLGERVYRQCAIERLNSNLQPI